MKTKSRTRTMWSITDSTGFYLWPNFARRKKDVIAAFTKEGPEPWLYWWNRGFRAVKIEMKWEAPNVR